MKKLLAIALIVIFIFCFVGCTKIAIDPEEHELNTGESEGQSEGEGQNGESEGQVEENDNVGGGDNCEQDPLLQVRPTSISTYERDLLANFPIEMDSLKFENYIATSTHTALTETFEIIDAGVYEFSGNFTDSINIAANVNVTIVLNNATFVVNGLNTISAGASSIVTITSLPNTENMIKCTGKNEANKSIDAISTKGDLIFNGEGKLEIISETKNGIKANGSVQIIESNLVISSDNHAIAARYVNAKDCEIKVKKAPKDGINADDELSAFAYEGGYVYFDNVKYDCSVKGDGIQADTFVYAKDSDITIVTQGKFVEKTQENIDKYELEEKDFGYIFENDEYKKIPKDFRTPNREYYALSQSCRGVRVSGLKDENDELIPGKYFIYLENNHININSTDDSINCKGGSVSIKDGETLLITKDHGIDCDYNTTLYSGLYTINSYEAISGTYVEILDGTYDLVATDDGINATTDDDGVCPYIIIRGGKIDIDIISGTGDAIDANGKILITGGDIVAQTKGQESLDSDFGTWLDGGNILGVVYAAVISRTYSSDQVLTTFNIKTNIAKDSNIVIKSGETELFNVIAKNEVHIITFATELLKANDDIEIYVDGAILVSAKVEGYHVYFDATALS